MMDNEERVSTRRLSLSLPVFEDAVDDDEWVPSKLEGQVSTKLEVMTSNQFNIIIKINIILGVITFVHIVCVSILCRTVWNGVIPRDMSKFVKNLPVRACRIHKSPYDYAMRYTDIVGQVLLMVFSVVFAIRVLGNKKIRVSREQIWCVFMVISTSLSYNPLGMLSTIFGQGKNYRNKGVWLQIGTVVRAIGLLFASLGQLFYVWCSAHSYGTLEIGDQISTSRLSFLRLYVPKLVLLIIFGAYRLVLRFKFKISPSKLPLTSFFTLIRNCQISGYWPADVFIKVGVLTAIETIIILAIARRLIITARTLRKVEYLKHRTKQVGFRYFVAQNCISFAYFMLADIALVWLIQRDFSMAFLQWNTYVLRNVKFGSIVRLLNYATTVITAWGCLPADSIGFCGLFRGTNQVRKENLDEHVISVKTMPPAKSFTSFYFSKKFILDLEVMLLSVSSLAYKTINDTVNTFLKENKITLEHIIRDEKTDTRVLILQSESFIIVAFRGTKSTENMKTDIKVAKVRLGSNLPTLPRRSSQNYQLIESSSEWKSAEVHKGFMEAYKSVCADVLQHVSDMTANRPIGQNAVYLCGHSLGGALATICSLDIVLSLEWKQVYVSTFGSPRCGNSMWSRLYDRFVPAHWRVAMRSDIVTTIPKMKYAHVGNLVSLTSSGDMFLDPNSIDIALWSSAVTGIADHRSAAYAKAFESFCLKNQFGYTPRFIKTVQEEEEGISTKTKVTSGC